MSGCLGWLESEKLAGCVGRLGCDLFAMWWLCTGLHPADHPPHVCCAGGARGGAPGAGGAARPHRRAADDADAEPGAAGGAGARLHARRHPQKGARPQAVHQVPPCLQRCACGCCRCTAWPAPRMQHCPPPTKPFYAVPAWCRAPLRLLSCCVPILCCCSWRTWTPSSPAWAGSWRVRQKTWSAAR